MRNDAIELLVLHFGKVGDYIYVNKSELIHKDIFKPYLKYLSMIVLAVGIIKKPF